MCSGGVSPLRDIANASSMGTSNTRTLRAAACAVVDLATQDVFVKSPGHDENNEARMTNDERMSKPELNWRLRFARSKCLCAHRRSENRRHCFRRKRGRTRAREGYLRSIHH